MDFEMNEEQKSLVALAKEFCQREVDPEYIKDLSKERNIRDRMPWDMLKKAHDTGLATLAIPKKYGGGGASFRTLLLVGEALSLWGGSAGTLIVRPWKFCADLACGSDELQDEIFTKLMRMDKFYTATTITEADAGSDSQIPYDAPGTGMKTFAYRDGGEWVINGEKHFNSGGGQADFMLVYARTDKEAPISKGMSFFLVPTDTPGFSIVRVNDLAESLNPLEANVDPLFDNVRIPERYLIGEKNKAYTYWNSSVGRQTIYLGPVIGSRQRMYELTREYAKTRIQGGKPIFEHLNIGPLVVSMRASVETLRAFAYRVAWEYDKATDDRTNKEALINMSPMWHLLVASYNKELNLKFLVIAAEVFGGAASLKETPIAGHILACTEHHSGGTRSAKLIKCMDLI